MYKKLKFFYNDYDDILLVYLCMLILLWLKIYKTRLKTHSMGHTYFKYIVSSSPPHPTPPPTPFPSYNIWLYLYLILSPYYSLGGPPENTTCIYQHLASSIRRSLSWFKHTLRQMVHDTSGTCQSAVLKSA